MAYSQEQIDKALETVLGQGASYEDVLGAAGQYGLSQADVDAAYARREPVETAASHAQQWWEAQPGYGVTETDLGLPSGFDISSIINPITGEKFTAPTQTDIQNAYAANQQSAIENQLAEQLSSQWEAANIPTTITGIDRAKELARILTNYGITDLSKLGINVTPSTGERFVETGGGGVEQGGPTGYYEPIPDQYKLTYGDKAFGELGGFGSKGQTAFKDPEAFLKENVLASSAAGEGWVDYRVGRDAQGNIALYPTWQTSSDLADYEPIIATLAALPTPIQPYAAAINAAINFEKGDWKGGIASLAATGGVPPEISTAVKVANAVDRKDWVSAAMGGLDLAGVKDIGGISTKDVKAAINIGTGLRDGNITQTINGANAFVDSPNVTLANKALALINTAKNFAKTGNPRLLVNAVKDFGTAFGKSAEPGTKDLVAEGTGVGFDSGDSGAVTETVDTESAPKLRGADYVTSLDALNEIPETRVVFDEEGNYYLEDVPKEVIPDYSQDLGTPLDPNQVLEVTGSRELPEFWWPETEPDQKIEVVGKLPKKELWWPETEPDQKIEVVGKLPKKELWWPETTEDDVTVPSPEPTPSPSPGPTPSPAPAPAPAPKPTPAPTPAPTPTSGIAGLTPQQWAVLNAVLAGKMGKKYDPYLLGKAAREERIQQEQDLQELMAALGLNQQG